ncbi:MAG: hypothetical protein HY791_17350 [Deltaproteobacteria bacterium]|nr:hypothetical protein [Deltaproteobacteria bacterium]
MTRPKITGATGEIYPPPTLGRCNLCALTAAWTLLACSSTTAQLQSDRSDPADAGARDSASDAKADWNDSSQPDAASYLDAFLDPDAAHFDGSVLDGSDLDAEPGDTAVHRPVVFVHGINGSAAEFDVMIDRLVADGWPSDGLFAIQFEDPRWGCNVDNAQTIADEVARVRLATGSDRVDLVAHSMGALSSRHYVKFLGGSNEVNTYVSLGGLHHGNRSACLNPLDVCVWQELCPTHEFISALDADPATPGDLFWVSIFSTDDGTVPVEVSRLDGAENIQVSGVAHAGPGGLTEDLGVYAEVVRVLSYPRW